MFEKRSYDLEHLDKGDYTEDEYEDCLNELSWINHYLGDTRALRKSLWSDINNRDLKFFSILDVGAGSGELLRTVAEWNYQAGRNGKLFGLEINERAAISIIERSSSYEGISAIRGDALCLPFDDNSFDYSICSLMTHHFRDDVVVRILKELNRVTRHKIFVIDLHRHPIAYYLCIALSHLMLRNRLIREDGALSILRSFRPNELKQLAEQAGLKDISLFRSFPFRLVLSGNK
jgi:ubiquinone/menaquinone biosynthesis C-methylase UbiE